MVVLPPTPSRGAGCIAERNVSQSCWRYAHLTNVCLELKFDHDKTTATTTDDVVHNIAILSTVPSPFTGPDAVVSLPGSLHSLADARRPHILDDYGDLTPLADMIHDKSKFRIVVEPYNGATVRDHVQRTRALLDGNAPFVTSLMEEGGGENKKETEGATGDGLDKPTGTEGDAPEDGAATPADGPEKEGDDGTAAGTDMGAPTVPAPETGKT